MEPSETTEQMCGRPWRSAWHAAGRRQGWLAVRGQGRVSPEEEEGGEEVAKSQWSFFSLGAPGRWAPNGKICIKKSVRTHTHPCVNVHKVTLESADESVALTLTSALFLVLG